MGAGWGATQPLSKVAVSEGYRFFGLIFWQSVIGCLVLGALQVYRRKPLRITRAGIIVFLFVSLVGTVIPNATSYEAIRHLPAGLTSMLLALIPMVAFPVALALGNERFQFNRLIGLGLGLAGVLLIVGPEASLPERAVIVFVPLSLVSVLCYAFEGNVLARWGTADMDPIEVLFGATVLSAAFGLVLAVGTGQFIDPRGPWGAPDAALIATSTISIVVYTTYVWMVVRAGPVFAGQVSYLVTGFGVLWSILFLGETYSGWLWAALGLMLLGLFFVQPRPRAPQAPLLAPGKDAKLTPNG
ncbi:MAG: DMT family transporter [Silicimonas sp.]|nr:DMT family transporter [Silicimonas sp.]